MSLIAGIDIQSILAVAAGIVIFSAIILGLGAIMFSGIGALIFGAGILALIALGAAMIILGAGIQVFNKGVSGIGDNIQIFVDSMAGVIEKAPQLLAAAVLLGAFGIALLPFGVALLLVGPALVIFGLGLSMVSVTLPIVTELLALFVASLVTMSEQIPSIIGLATSFMLLTTSMIALATTMVVFTPIFTFGTLVTAALVPAMLFAAFGTGLWAASVQFLSTSFESLIPNLMTFLTAIPMMGMLVTLIPGLVALSGAFFLLSTSLFSLGAGLGFIGLFLPVLAALGILLPTVAGAFGYGDDESESSSIGGDSGASMNDVVEELRALREDIQQQPILIKVDGKVVSAMSKVQARKQSVRNSGYGG